MKSNVQCQVQAPINENKYEVHTGLRRLAEWGKDWNEKGNKANMQVWHLGVQNKTLRNGPTSSEMTSLGIPHKERKKRLM
jgi:hypothetical protein